MGRTQGRMLTEGDEQIIAAAELYSWTHVVELKPKEIFQRNGSSSLSHRRGILRPERLNSAQWLAS